MCNGLFSFTFFQNLDRCKSKCSNSWKGQIHLFLRFGSRLTSIAMSMHNFIKIFKKFQEIGPVSLFFRIWTSATPRSIPNDIWQSLGLYLVNINMYAKLHHKSPVSLAIFTFSEFGARHNLEMSFCNLLGYIWQSLCLDHVNSNEYANFYQNIPKGSRDRTSFTFFRIWTSAKPRPILNIIWQSHWLHLVNINVYAKFHHNILHSSRNRAIFTFSESSRQSLDR